VKESSHSKRAFSLIELIVVVAVVAALSAVVVVYFGGMVEASHVAADRQNVNQWNTAYTYVMGADPTFATLEWSDASSKLAAGVEIIQPKDTVIRAPIPVFYNENVVDSFVPGTGLTWDSP
jgi:prepilin-type N-terminal cleavage/methylation domain-containing protein